MSPKPKKQITYQSAEQTYSLDKDRIFDIALDLFNYTTVETKRLETIVKRTKRKIWEDFLPYLVIYTDGNYIRLIGDKLIKENKDKIVTNTHDLARLELNKDNLEFMIYGGDRLLNDPSELIKIAQKYRKR